MSVTRVQTCALPISARCRRCQLVTDGEAPTVSLSIVAVAGADRKSVVLGKRVDLGGCRIIKKKKTTEEIYECDESSDVCSSDLGQMPQVPTGHRRGGADRVAEHRRGGGGRSEERRVGKEGRSRWLPYH